MSIWRDQSSENGVLVGVVKLKFRLGIMAHQGLGLGFRVWGVGFGF